MMAAAMRQGAMVQHENADDVIEISMASGADCDEWDRFVGLAPDATHFHQHGWGQVIQSVYGYKPAYLMARRKGEVVGVLPLIDVKSPLLGHSLVSTAFTVGGGPLTRTPAIAAKLAEAAAKIGEERRVQYVELRSGKACVENWVTKQGKYATFHRAISSDHDANLKAVPRKRRAEIRKAIALVGAGDLDVSLDRDIDRFYALYARSVRDLGTPIFPRRFIDEIASAFGDQVEVSTAVYRGKAVASLVSFYFRDAVMPYFIGAAPGAREARAHDFLYWSLMQRAAGRGVKEFDFGRSKIGSGPYAYKKLWGFAPAPLDYQYWLVKAAALPDVNPNNPKFAVFAKIWRRLPLPAANFLGPMLAPNFP